MAGELPGEGEGDDEDVEVEALTAPRRAGRLDRWLADQLPLSRSRLKALIQSGEVTVDGAPARPSHRLEGGEAVRVRLPAPEPTELVAQDLGVPILHMDDHIVVVDKPVGMVVHPARGHADGTLVNGLLHHLRAAGGDPMRPGIVHRLDKGTSGTMVVARTEAAHAHLAAQFAARSVHRRYLALCWGQPEPPSGVIDAAHGRHPTDRIRFAVVEPERGKHAVTRYHSFGAGQPPGTGRGGLVSLVGCRLETGRTHQIRVHLEHLGHPLLGDPMYGAGRRRPSAWQAHLRAVEHQQLHAAQLGFVHPATGAEMRFATAPPAVFGGLAALLGLALPDEDALAGAL